MIMIYHLYVECSNNPKYINAYESKSQLLDVIKSVINRVTNFDDIYLDMMLTSESFSIYDDDYGIRYRIIFNNPPGCLRYDQEFRIKHVSSLNIV